MIEVAKLASPRQDICYVGMDLFEGRSESDGPGLSLKAAHQFLRGVGGRVQLVPGNPAESLARTANSLGKIDLLIVPAELDSPSSSRAWFFVPRMLHERRWCSSSGLPTVARRLCTLSRRPRSSSWLVPSARRPVLAARAEHEGAQVAVAAGSGGETAAWRGPPRARRHGVPVELLLGTHARTLAGNPLVRAVAATAATP